MSKLWTAEPFGPQSILLSNPARRAEVGARALPLTLLTTNSHTPNLWRDQGKRRLRQSHTPGDKDGLSSMPTRKLAWNFCLF